MVKEGKYLVVTIAHKSNPDNEYPTITGYFAIRDSSISFAREVDKFNCDAFPEGPVNGRTILRISEWLSGYSNGYVTRKLLFLGDY